MFIISAPVQQPNPTRVLNPGTTAPPGPESTQCHDLTVKPNPTSPKISRLISTTTSVAASTQCQERKGTEEKVNSASNTTGGCAISPLNLDCKENLPKSREGELHRVHGCVLNCSTISHSSSHCMYLFSTY